MEQAKSIIKLLILSINALFSYYKMNIFTTCCEKAKSDQLLDSIQPCQQHDEPIMFVCLEQSCKKKSLFCSTCFERHKGHNISKVSTFFSQQLRAKLRKGQISYKQLVINGLSSDVRQLQQMKQNISDIIDDIISLHKEQIQEIQKKSAPQSVVFSIQEQKKVDNNLILKIKKMFQIEQNNAWIDIMRKDVKNLTDETQRIIKNIFESFMEVFKRTDWGNIEDVQQVFKYKDYLQKLAKSVQIDTLQFKFSQQLRHKGVKLSEDSLEATYKRNIPSKPVIICDKNFMAFLSSITFQIVKLEKTALLFPATSIFLGACNPTLVRGFGFRKINEASKGAYMIGSTGWSYHHDNPDYDRKQVVGWGFKQGDRITITVNLQEPGSIKFVKPGRIYNNQFTMPLDLNSKQLKDLHPCVSFDAQIGAVVRILKQVPNSLGKS